LDSQQCKHEILLLGLSKVFHFCLKPLRSGCTNLS